MPLDKKSTDKNLEKVVMLKAGIICVKSSNSRAFISTKSLQ